MQSARADKHPGPETPPPKTPPPPPSPTVPPIKKKKKKKQARNIQSGSTESPKAIWLASAPLSARFCWTESYDLFWHLTVKDKFPDASTRPLPRSELLCMALQEVAANHRRLQFFHSRNHESWKKNKGENFCPSARYPVPRSDFISSIICADLAWSTEGVTAFLNRSHQDRFDLSDMMLNPPAEDAPCWSIQTASSYRHKLFQTSPTSLIVLITPNGFYLLDTSEYREVIGLWGEIQEKSYAPQGESNPDRLDTTKWLWPSELVSDVEEEEQGKQSASSLDAVTASTEPRSRIAHGSSADRLAERRMKMKDATELFKVRGGLEELYCSIQSRILKDMLIPTALTSALLTQTPRPLETRLAAEGSALGSR